MKFIDNVDKPLKVKDSVIKFFNIQGKETETENQVFSKSISINLGEEQVQNKFFIRTFNNMPLDPLAYNSDRIWARTELKPVSEATFGYYNNYLSTKNKLFLTKTNRSFING